MKLEHKLFELKDFAVQMAKLRNEKHFDFLVTIVGEDVGEGIKDVGDGVGEGVEDLTGGGSRDANQQNAR